VGTGEGGAIKQVENAGAFYFGHLVLALLLFAARWIETPSKDLSNPVGLTALQLKPPGLG
jgi:hypothetical protein